MQQQPLKQSTSPDISPILSQSQENLEIGRKMKDRKVLLNNPIVSSKLHRQSIMKFPYMNGTQQKIGSLKNNLTSENENTPQIKNTMKRDDPGFNKILPSLNNFVDKPMKIRKIIDTFISNLKQQSYIRQTSQFQQQKRLQEEEYLIQKDTDQNETNSQHRLQQSINLAQKTSFDIIKISVFEPLTMQMYLWRAIHTITQLLIFWYVPVLLSFKIDSLIFMRNIEAIFFIVLILDGFIQLNSAYISRGQIVRLRQKIFINYVRNKALKDISELLALLLIFVYHNQPWIILIVFIYLYLSIEKIAFTISSVQEYFHFNGIMNEAVNLIQLIIIILLISHICACLWHFVGQQSLQHGYNSWILQKNLGEATTFSLYNYSFYWATMTMVTVGYGDVSPQNDLEVCVATCTMFVTCGVFAFAINTIGKSLANMEEQKVNTKKVFSQINQFMSSHQVSYDLQGRVRNYLEYCFKQDHDLDYENVEYIFDKLSPTIKQELTKQIRGKAITQCKVINQSFSQCVQNQLLPYMERLRFSPEEVIFKKNTQDDSSIYMIQKGEVELLCNDRVLQKLKVGDSFGEISFFTGQIRCCTVKAVDFVKVYKLSQEAALKVLLNHPAQNEKWCHIRDQIRLYENYDAAKMSCYSCGQSNHLVTACPSLFYKPDLERIIKQQDFRDGQIRSKLKRIGSKQSSLGIFQQLQDQASQIHNKIMKYEINEVEEEDDSYAISQGGSEDILTYKRSVQRSNAEQSHMGRIRQKRNSVQQDGGSVSPIKSLNQIQPEQQNYSYFNFISEINQKENQQLVKQEYGNKFQKEKLQSELSYNDNYQPEHREQEKQTYITRYIQPVENSKDTSYNSPRGFKVQNNYLQTLPTLGDEKDQQFNYLAQNKRQTEMFLLAQLSQLQEDDKEIQSAEKLQFFQNHDTNTIGQMDRIQLGIIKQSPRLSPSVLRSISTMKPVTRGSFSNTNIILPNSNHDQTVQSVQIDCHQMMIFDIYFPHNNYDPVIIKTNRFLKQKQKIIESRYSWYYSVKQRAQKIQILLNKKYSTFQ